MDTQQDNTAEARAAAEISAKIQARAARKMDTARNDKEAAAIQQQRERAKAFPRFSSKFFKAAAKGFDAFRATAPQSRPRVRKGAFFV